MTAASSPRVCLVTGAGRGLGRAIAVHLARPDTRLLLHHHASAKGAEDTATEAEARGSQVTLLQADLADPAGRERLMDAVERHTQALQVLVNNAGVFPDAPLLDITPEEWQRTLDITCSAVFHLTRRAVPLLRAGAPARVINIGDSAADRITAHTTATPYHVAKLGVHVLTRSFARALGPDGITVNLLSPGFLEGSLGSHGAPIPAGREGRPQDLLGALDYLLSSAADYVSGANLVVSGAWNV